MIKVFRGGILIDGTGREPIEDVVVIVEGSRMKSVGKEGEVGESHENRFIYMAL